MEKSRIGKSTFLRLHEGSSTGQGETSETSLLFYHKSCSLRMAPILSASVGITRQIVDDVKLRTLRNSLEELKSNGPLNDNFASIEEYTIPLDIEKLVSLLEPWRSWPFDEQVDLQEWIEPLNKIDASLSYYMQKYPSLLLVGPVKRTNSKGTKKNGYGQPVSKPAKTIEEIKSVPDTVHKNLAILLNFLTGLLRNSCNKSIFNSTEELVDLLAAADDDIATFALEALCALAPPPSVHKQQVPEAQQHTTTLHLSKPLLHKRLIALAKGWGTRGSGLGLYTCAVADDSESGQGSLLQQAGELNFTFFRAPKTEEKESDDEVDESYLVRISLQAKDIIDDSCMVTDPSKFNEESDDSSKQKRRRVAPNVSGGKRLRSTAELFFQCVDQAGGLDEIPTDRLFPLLADIRLARAFYCRETRIAAIERRLYALITCLHSHPSQDIMTGYFQAQPELCVELVDLLRPTVSSSVISSGTSSSTSVIDPSPRHDSVAALSNSPVVPYSVRHLAIQTLTALVARRDGTNGALAGAARHSNVLNELGVGKGQYLGLLPTLIRFSLATLGALVSFNGDSGIKEASVSFGGSTEGDIGMDLGLAFVEATSPPPLSKFLWLQRALLFVESVLDLTSAVVTAPTGTSSLTECGLIPALLNTISIDSIPFVDKMILQKNLSEIEGWQIRSMFKFIAAQAVQILESSIASHGNALSAFHNLQGVKTLTTCLSNELKFVSCGRGKNPDVPPDSMDLDVPQTDAMVLESDSPFSVELSLWASQRVLLFGVVTCLTVVFHQESTSSTVTPSGSSELRKPELTESVKEILDNVEVYGGHLASLVSTLLSDVMNSDPHVVHYVHESGLAKSFLSILADTSSGEPISPPVPEFIMTIPNVLAALALTEAGAKVVKEANPFPGVLKLFHHPKYAMPRSRCLLNDMTSIVGSGLDEIMRHVPSLKRPICSAISDAIMEVVSLGSAILSKEEELSSSPDKSIVTDVDIQRTCLMQYALNFGQILEQLLHTDDHCDPFVQAGGLDAILKLYPLMMPAGENFLDNVSCLSCPSISTLCHSTTEETLSLVFKCIALKYDPLKCLQTIASFTKQHLDCLESSQLEMRAMFPSTFDSESPLDAFMILHGLPHCPIYEIIDPAFAPQKILLSKYLREIAVVQWLTSILSSTIRACFQRSQESGSGWSRAEREWKKELASPEFQTLFSRLSIFFQSATLEVCRIRTEKGYEEHNLLKGKDSAHGVRYKLRIVCSEGAIVRDGTEIDDCASVGSMEMGEIVEAYDRCINSSGVLRYHTNRGWVSEQTRGHGREPISEVLAVWSSPVGQFPPITDTQSKRIEFGVPDLSASAANVLARLQSCHSEIYGALTRVEMQSIRSLSVRSVTFQEETIGHHVSTMLGMVQKEISRGFQRHKVLAASNIVNKNYGVALYLGSLLNLLQTCLFEEKRDRRTVNLPMLIPLVGSLSRTNSGQEAEDISIEFFGIFDAIAFIFEVGLNDFQSRSSVSQDTSGVVLPIQRLSRTTASCFPTGISVLRRMLSIPGVTSSPAAVVLGKMKTEEVAVLVGEGHASNSQPASSGPSETFSVDQFARKLFAVVSDVVMAPWSDPRFAHAPTHIVHPMATLVSETISILQDSMKVSAPASSSAPRESTSVWNPFRSMLQSMSSGSQAVPQNEDFEPSEEAIARLMEMGFSRDHAWEAIDSVGSNRVEIAAEYALAHPASSPTTIELRRNERAARRRRLEEQHESVNQEVGTGEGSPASNIVATSEFMNEDQLPTDKDTPKDTTIEMVSSRVDSWKVQGPKVVCEILLSIQPDASASENGDAENEALAVVLSSFILDMYQRYPDSQKEIVKSLLIQVKNHLKMESEGSDSTWSVISGHDASLSSLIHCTVIVVRALPKERVLILKEELVGKIISIVSGVLKKLRNGEVDCATRLPPWLPSSLLLLELMAQPFVAFPKKDEPEDEIGSTEMNEVKLEHAKYMADFSCLAQALISALSKQESLVPIDAKNSAKEIEGSMLNVMQESPAIHTDGNSGNDKGEGTNFFSSVPPYLPLLPSRCFEMCADLCLGFLDESSKLPAGVAHATLLLLMRLIRNTRMSTYCLNSGAGEKILALSQMSRFSGHTSLASIIFRRLLEDEQSLQLSMENEIRSIILKLDGKKDHTGTSEKEKVVMVKRKPFLDAVTHLLCRDPDSFIKAMAVSVKLEKDSSNDEWRVCLVTNSDRMKNMRIVAEISKSKKLKHATANRKSSTNKHRRSSTGSRSKTPTRSFKRSHTPKRSKKDKIDTKEKSEEEHPKLQTQHHTPVSQVIWMLGNHIIQGQMHRKHRDSSLEGDLGGDGLDFGFNDMFLWTSNALDVLADLIIALPACASSIHKFKPSKKNRFFFNCLENALSGCPHPPKTFVSFLLHGILSIDRDSHHKAKEPTGDQMEEQLKKEIRKMANIRTKVVQSAARLLVALVARPGESRKRVITELVFALSGGQLGFSVTAPKNTFRIRAIELHALKAWGELSIGFAAPRSNGSNYDGNSSLSFEVVKIMLENGMVHALLISMHRVPLHHPLAATTVGALILPFEILTRSNVADVVKAIIEKEGSTKEGKEVSRLRKQSEVGEGVNTDDHMLEDAFAVDDEHVQRDPMEGEFFEGERVQIDQDGGPIIDDEHPMIGIGSEEIVGMEESEDDGSSESEESSSTGDSEEESEDESGDEDDSEDDSESEEDDSLDDEDDDDSILEDAEESADFEDNGIDLEYGEDGLGGDNDFEGDDDDDAEPQADGFIEEGWTQVEPGGFGGVLGRRTATGTTTGTTVGRGRGFIDAAEAMIGQLLRSGEIPTEALAEIEGTLGIRIVQPGSRPSDSTGGNRGLNLLFDGSPANGNTNSGNRRGPNDVSGLQPVIVQRSQPEFGYSSMGGGGRWHEINSMEYVFGGPCITAGNRNYDLSTPIVLDDNDDMIATLGANENNPTLFPGGPAAATHPRYENALHPLLNGVNLPPQNALVSDLQPHGIRARNAQSSTRREGQRGLYISSTGSGVIVSQGSRPNRPLPSSGHGWTDDGLPLGVNAEQFGVAFESALDESMAAVARQAILARDASGNHSVTGGEDTHNGDSIPVDNEDQGGEDVNMPDTGNDGEGEESANSPIDVADETPVEQEHESPPTDANDGDGVASSLAEGLRLSPGDSGPAEHEEHPESNQITETLQDQEMLDAGEYEEIDEGNTTEQNDANRTEAPQREAIDTEQNEDVSGSNALVCPPGMDEEVFSVLPMEMQMEVVREAQEALELSEQLGAGSLLDPETLAALPDDVRREVIAQEQQERREREQPPADPSNAEDMDNASFLASLAPELRTEILLTADDAFIASLPPIIATEAQVLRERARANHRMLVEQRTIAPHAESINVPGEGEEGTNHGQGSRTRDHNEGHSSRKKRGGKFRVELDRMYITYIPPRQDSLGSPLAKADLKALLRFLYLLSPVRPHKLLQKVFQNLTVNPHVRSILSTVFLKFLQDDNSGGLEALDTIESRYTGPNDWRFTVDTMFEESLRDFPPALLIGTAPEVLETDGLNPTIQMMRRRQTTDTAASIAANLPITSRGSHHEQYLPPVVATRIVDTLQHLCKHSPRFCLDMLVKGLIEKESASTTGFESLLDLLEKPRYSKSSANLEQLLSLLELIVSPLSHLPRHGEETADMPQREIEAALSQGKEWVDVPRVAVSQERLQLLCAILRMETCKDTSFTKINTIARRLCRVDANRGYVLAELASVARALGADAIRDLKALNIRMSAAAAQSTGNNAEGLGSADSKREPSAGASASSSVAVSTSTSELKLLRVLQTLQSLCTDYPDENVARRSDGLVIVNDEMVRLLEAMELDELWMELSSCLKIVQVLEGVNIKEDAETKAGGNIEGELDDQNENIDGKKLQNSVAGLLTRFLPSIEAFFVANASATAEFEKDDQELDAEEDGALSRLVGGSKLIQFVESNKVLINALIRNNPNLLDRGLRALIQVPRCRVFLDFDVKRHWFKLQVRRLRQHANRRHGSLRLHVRRQHVFEDTYHQLRLRNADEMRGRLNITFRNEQGVDAGGLSREFFGVLAKEIFNPNYALFTSTEDGSTFQPNPNSSINPDHLSYFRFVGRIVGKAVSDGYLLDAYFTRSLYKHMLGIKPSHPDMEAIDPDYYKNLKTILEYDLGDLGLDLTFSIEDHSFGTSQTVDLIEDGRNVPVTEENKAKYVSLVCQHRMTTAISSQIKSYLDGFYELVSKDLIQIFTPRELELLISGLPDIDILDLKKNTDYVGWKATDQQIEWFWNVMFSLSRKQKASFLQFVTGSSKVPLAGFGELPGMRGVQKFSIHKAGGSTGALMSAHTCFNSLDLPVYKSEDELREKLLYAINEGGGAFLMV
ncbi:HECT-domain ubiquitin-transferase [Nitzschia inconspicua]|uniref:HECT-type E3 ubiquitin transferase n=1 Tax=Nitzschia inconspicua TaxID=303405 RepID=A0A9K3PMF3_9STRA|nr:HECT-domain ubiquitin-transferase [Nitzschia inconspicua]